MARSTAISRTYILGGAALLLAGAGALTYALWPEDEPLPPAPPAERFADIPKIDVHVHAPAEMAALAVRLLGEQGVGLALNASGGAPGNGLQESMAAAQATGGRLLPYCNLSFAGVEADSFAADAALALRACKELGAIGLKIFKALGLGYTTSDGRLLAIDDPRLDPVFELAGELGLPVLIHSGDPRAFFEPPTPDNERFEELQAHPSWSFHGERPDGGGPWPSWDELLDQFERRVARHPGTRFLGAHFGNAPEDPERVARMLERYPNLFVETGARIPEIGRHPAERMRRLFQRFHDRILFGTDFQMGRFGFALGSSGEEPDPPERIPFFFRSHWRYFETTDRDFPHPTPIQGRWTIDGIDLPEDVLHDLYHRNAERLFGVRIPQR